MVMYTFYAWGSTFYLTWLHTCLVEGRGFGEEEMKSVSTLPFVLGALANPLGGVLRGCLKRGQNPSSRVVSPYSLGRVEGSCPLFRHPLSDALSRKLGVKLGRRLVGSTCLAVAALFLLATALTTGKWSGIILLALGFGVLDLMLPSAWAICMDVGGKYAGAVSGAMNSFGHIGGTLCSVLFGYLVEETGSYNTPLLVIAGMVLAAAFLFAWIDPSRPLPEEQEPPPAEGPTCV